MSGLSQQTILHTVNDEDVCRSGRDIRNVEEMDVVLSKGHHGLVAGRVWDLLIIDPRDRRAVSCLEQTHVQREHVSVGEGI